jgi:tetraacyldisaccharide 4'-kinase
VKGETYFRKLVNGEAACLADRLLLFLLVALSIPYSLFMRCRAFLYRIGIIPSRSLPRPVISVGNVTMGGTGKTPMTLFLARELMGRGKRVAVLTRGYGGSKEGETLIVADGSGLLLGPEEAGDEPCLLASALPGLMVVMGPNRYAAGELAMARLDPDLFIVDDGFQHLRLKRDLDILLLDGNNPFATGRAIPAGMLRESPSAVGRADLIVFTRCRDREPPKVVIPDEIPCVASSHRLAGFQPLTGGECRPLSELVGRRVLAFAGIADPAPFFDGLEGEGVPLVATIAFPDHTAYGAAEMEAIGRLKQAKKADCFITTAKDAVKLMPYRGILKECHVAQLELVLHDREPLFAALDKILN